MTLMAGLMMILMNLWCYPLMVLWTCVGIVLFPLIFGFGYYGLRMPPDRTMRWIIWLYGRVWLALMSPFVRFRRENLAQLKRGEPGPCLWLIICLFLIPTAWLCYRSTILPLQCGHGRSGCSGIVSSCCWHVTSMLKGTVWDQVSCDSQKAFDQGGAVLFFPEGHRSRDGQLQRFLFRRVQSSH